MGAHIIEGSDLSIFAAHHDKALLAEIIFEPVASIRDIGSDARERPDLGPHLLAGALKTLGFVFSHPS